MQELQEDLEAQQAITEKAKKMATTAKIEIDWLRVKLQQSSDRETIIRTIARKSMKEIQAKQDELVIAHIQAIANLANHRKALERAEEAINEQWEEMFRRATGGRTTIGGGIAASHGKGNGANRSFARQRIKDLANEHGVNSRPLCCAVRAHCKQIKQLEDTIQEMRAKTEMSIERIETLLSRRKESALKMIADKVEQGCEAWSTQAAKLHILRAN